MAARRRRPGSGMLPPAMATNLLPPCPDRPNCVSTEAEDAAHRMDPIPYQGAPELAVRRLVTIIEGMPGGRVVHRDGHSLHAELTSRVFRFVDDVDLLVDADAGLIRFRSASRVGYSDLGANRRRMQRIRRAFLAAS